VTLLIYLDDPIVELGLGRIQVLLGLGQLALGLFGRSSGVGELCLGVVVVFNGCVQLIGEVVDLLLQSLGLVLRLCDGRRFGPRYVAPQQGGYCDDQNDANETSPDAACRAGAYRSLPCRSTSLSRITQMSLVSEIPRTITLS
jgi:hypothetical protein